MDQQYWHDYLVDKRPDWDPVNEVPILRARLSPLGEYFANDWNLVIPPNR